MVNKDHQRAPQFAGNYSFLSAVHTNDEVIQSLGADKRYGMSVQQLWQEDVGYHESRPDQEN
jgi:hypothetical protein